MLGLIDPPAGSTRTTPPVELTDPAERPSMSNLVLADRTWSIPLSFADAQSWALAARPGGCPSDISGFGSSSGAGTAQRLWRVYEAPRASTFSVDQIQLSIAPHDADSSYLRADALVAALDPNPIPDSRDGQRVRVASGGPCPADVAAVVGVSNPGQSDLDRMLVPTDDPTSARICRYYGNGHGNRLIHTWKLGPTQAAKLASAARALPPAHDENVIRHCPAGFGAVSVIVFAYPARPDVDLWNTDDGCTFVGNGHVRNDSGALPDEPSAPPSS